MSTPAQAKQKSSETLIKEALQAIEKELHKSGSEMVSYANLVANIKAVAKLRARELANAESEVRRQRYVHNTMKTSLQNILGVEEGRVEETVSDLIGENHALRNACATQWGAAGRKVHRKACEFCGKSYVSQRSDRKYCSNSCRNKTHSETKAAHAND